MWRFFGLGFRVWFLGFSLVGIILCRWSFLFLGWLFGVDFRLFFDWRIGGSVIAFFGFICLIVGFVWIE